MAAEGQVRQRVSATLSIPVISRSDGSKRRILLCVPWNRVVFAFPFGLNIVVAVAHWRQLTGISDEWQHVPMEFSRHFSSSASSWLTGCFCLSLVTASAAAQDAVSFNRDIRPILSSHCLECHGRDESDRQAGLRLDERSAVIAKAESGLMPIVPGSPKFSELIRRVETDDASEIMPPADSNKQLTDAQKTLLRQWVTEGASYEEHWAFVPPEPSEPPAIGDSSWGRNTIDDFVLARLEADDISPSPEVDRATLFRRLSLDLTGLPPSPADFDLFEREMSVAETNDQDQAAAGSDTDATKSADRVYAAWVDQLLASPHFGERMAVDWLDAARFADTNGYQVDRDREMYAWRDWVINAFNSNMPFDQFTIEQLAGDLLPDATIDQRIATGFHRNHMLNEEGGILPEEFLAEYCADRVETTATVWLGQTFLCARCHDHKYDPFTQRDFYSLYAFFHNISEVGVGNYGASIRRNAPPMLQLPAPELEARKATLKKELAAVEAELGPTEAAIAQEQPQWEQRVRQKEVTWHDARLTSVQAAESTISLEENQTLARIPSVADEPVQVTIEVRCELSQITALRVDITQLSEPGAVSGTSNVELSQLRVFEIPMESVGPSKLALRAIQVGTSLAPADVAKGIGDAKKTSARLSLTGDAASSLAVELEPAYSVAEQSSLRFELTLTAPQKTAPLALRFLATDAAVDVLVPSDIAKIVGSEPSSRSDEDTKRLQEFRKAQSAEHRRMKSQIADLKSQIDKTDLEIPTALVMEEMETPRPTHILLRGAYNAKGDVVSAGTPAALPAMSPDLPRNRLGLARWLVDPTNPLTARVAVNRIWQSLFGQGLVRTAEDFGTQGEPPSHPELLDWLATEFVRSGWDVKAMVSLMVNSSTYRQSSRLTPLLVGRDPNNRLLARAPRYRLQAEFLRDQALAAGGLLVLKIGGPSVRPYHPSGLYEQVVAGSSANTYVVGKGSELYRRSLYTYWKRSVPNPAMLLFDAPFRETCTMRRSRTNTPLQALNLMNDPTFVEAARCLAQRMSSEGGDSPSEWIDHGFRLLLVRSPGAQELATLEQAYARSLKQFQNDSDAAAELLSVGESPVDTQIEQPQLAALTIVASTILNLDETVTKE